MAPSYRTADLTSNLKHETGKWRQGTARAHHHREPSQRHQQGRGIRRHRPLSLPDDNVIVFAAQMDRLRKIIDGGELPQWRRGAAGR